MKKHLLLLFLLAFSSYSLLATHNRAGEITYKWISGFTYEFTITTYTKDSAPADRCELTIDFGDGSSAIFYRSNGSQGLCPSPARMGENLGNDVRKNIYFGQHTYQAPGYYTITMQDLNRNGGINNIPNSINVPFFVSTSLLVDPSLGANSSPVLTNPPIDNGCTNRKFIHNPSAFDVDGDSLFYSLVFCKGLGGVDILETYDPVDVQDSVKIDSITGDFIWDVPKNIGQYNFAILIQEFRKNSNGVWRLIGAVTRDFQVDITSCFNDPPVLKPIGPFCVIAGTQLNFTVEATDPNNDDLVLSGSGGPFIVSPSAIFPTESQPATGTNGFVSEPFIWNTACNLVRSQPYYAQFKVTDIPANPQDQELTDILSVEINIIAPAPQNPMATPNGENIDLAWDPEICTQAIGYDVYRREGSYGYVWDTCETGVPAYTGYLYQGSTFSINDTSYVDSNDLKIGVQYCYMVVARFPDGSESIASEEFCAELPKSKPIITNVDVLTTDAVNGSIQIRWIPPRQFDSATFPPPYTYMIERAEEIDGAGFTQVGTTPSFTDTSFTDNGMDTESKGYTYRVWLVSNGNNAIDSDPASSIFLKVSGLDKVNLLQFNYSTPWVNDTFVVYRENLPGVFDSIGFSLSNGYLDTGLTNGTEYCYRVKGIGAFTGSDLPSGLINNSQIACATPVDTNRPCPPILNFTADCEARELLLTWEDSIGLTCVSDIVEYKIYYKEQAADPWPDQPIATVPVSQKSYLVQGDAVVGCYGVTAVDDADIPNESFISNEICLDGCPVLELPNVFTPGQSGNRIFRPVLGPNGELLFRDIEEFKIEIFNRWGGLVYSTESADEFVTNGWDGTDINTKGECADGVYFYVVTYKPKSTQIIEEQILKGYIHLFR